MEKPIATHPVDWFSARKLISLLDMTKIFITDYAKAKFVVEWQHRDFGFAAAKHDRNDIVSGPEKASLLRHLKEDVLPQCELLCLEHSMRIIRQIEDACTREFAVPCLYHEAEGKLLSLSHTMDEELKERQFAFIPPEDAPFFEQDALFDKAVNDRFPSIALEIKEAGNCLAARLNTAAVFQLMRVMEYGLRRLHKSLRLPKPTNPNWSAVIQEIEKEIALRDRATPRQKAWSRNREFYTDAARHFRFFKDIRNRSVHVELPQDEYVSPDTETARRIFEEVKHFTQHLATKLKE